MPSDLEDGVKDHYTTQDLLDRIRAALTAAGLDPDAPSAEDLKGVDEFHTGGLAATEHLLDQLELKPDMRILDIGSGIGGTARHIALKSGASVTGVDLTPAFVEAARKLSDLVGLATQTTFEQGSALDMPVNTAAFDLATMFHVGMNIRNKERLMSQVARVLKPGGTFALFDVMAGPTGGRLNFPFPWAESEETSFVARPQTYRDAAAAAGLSLVAETDRSDFAKTYFIEMAEKMSAAGGPPPVSMHLLMRGDPALKLKNYVDEVHAGHIAPVEMIFRAPG